MDDLISRQAAMHACLDGWNKGYEEILALPSAQPEPQWIPCSERLPDEGQEVLGTDDSGDIRHVIKDKCGLLEFATYEEMMHIPIIAWMPLPEPYGGEQK